MTVHRSTPRDGLAVRRPRPSDAPAVLELVLACDLAGVGSSDATLTQVASDLERPGYDRDRGGLLVLDADARAVGWLWTDDHHTAERVFVDPYSLDGDVLAWLLEQGVAYARLLAGERGHAVSVAAGAYESDRLMTATLAAAGLVPVRHFWRMQVALDGSAAGADVGDLPAGVTVAHVGESDGEQRLMHRLATESFRDHWDHAPRSYEEWREIMDAPAGRDPSQWWVASVDGTPAGVLIGSEAEAEVLGISKVETLGVLRPYRRRGAAKALLRTAFSDARTRGRRAVALEVDSESPTGATRLYESVGMSVDKVLVSWRLRVAP